MAFFPFEQLETSSPRPLLVIAGSRADTPFWSQQVYRKAKEPKELHLVDGATHIDLYDRPQFVTPAVAKLKEFSPATSPPNEPGNRPHVVRRAAFAIRR